MRLRLVIVRHGLPAARILWTVPLEPGSRSVSTSEITSITAPNAAFGHGSCTIAQLLEDVNEVVPLETTADTLGESDEIGGQWGLEDYVVEVNGFECLHFMDVGGLLRDGDEVVIRALGLPDLRARKLSGRVQIATDGRRLIDGVPFGRPYLKRSFSTRPQIRIPSRKRRRTSHPALTGSLQDDDTSEGFRVSVDQAGRELTLYDDESILSSEQGTVIRRPPPPSDLFGDMNESDNDMESSYDDNEDLAQELEALKDDANETMITDQADLESPRLTRSAGRISRMAYREPIPTSSPARLSIVSAANFNANDSAVVEPSPKSTKSVRFQSPSSKQDLDTTILSSSSDSDDDSSESEEESDSEKSDMSDVAETHGLSEDSSSDSSDDSSISSDSESESEDETSPSPEKKKSPDIYTAPGKGSTKTKNSNRRKKLRMRLNKLKELGHLAPEANFDELREWEIQHGKRPLVELTDLERPRTSQARSEQSLFEQKREQLLRDLASGGIDVDAHSEKENIPPRYKNGKQADTEASTVDSADKPTQDGDETAQSIKRRKLDMSSTKRLVFGSLGVRTPKTKEDEEKTRNRLAGPRKESVVKQVLDASTEQEAEDDFQGNWQSKVIVEATECLYDDVQLQPPSFPFQQRWDHEAISLMRQRKGGAKNNKRNKKKNRKSQDYQEEGEEEYYDAEGYLGEDTEDYANGDITLNYDDEEYPNEDLANGDEEPDLPNLPEDLDSVPALTKDDVVAGAVIAFKQLDMSKATNWQPQISEYRVAKVDKLLEDGIISIQLAKRDREYREVVVDENGFREYSGLEMPGDSDEAEDDGIRDLPFDDLLEPKLLMSAAAPPADGNQEPSLYNLGGSNASADEPFPSVEAELPTVSSQTRLEISQIIRDAGFRDTVDSDVAMVINAANIQLSNVKDVEDAAAIEKKRSPVNNNESSQLSNSPFSWSSSPDVEEDSAVGVRNAKIERGNTNKGENQEEEDYSSPSKGDDQAMNTESHDDDDNDDYGGGDGLRINDDIPAIDKDATDGNNNNNYAPQKPFDWSPTSYQRPVETPTDTATDTQTTTYPRLPPMSSQPDADAENHGSEQNDDEPEPEPEPESENLGLGLELEDSQFQESAAVSQNKSFLSEFSDAESMIPNPFYEQDRSRTLAEEGEEGLETQATQETNEMDEHEVLNNSNNNNTPKKGNDLAETSLQQDDLQQDDTAPPGLDDPVLDEIDLDNIDLPTLDELWASTAPARPKQNAAALPTIKKTRRALSSPRQRSSSLAFETQEEQTQTLRRRPIPAAVRGNSKNSSSRNGGNRDASNSPPPAFETMETENVSFVDLTASSPRVSPEGGSDEDYARTQGLPRGPGWVKKNIPSTQRRTRSSTGGGGVEMTPSPVRRLRRRN